ncbi:MAG: hypothetical protein Q9163_003241 [Psora crenata]
MAMMVLNLAGVLAGVIGVGMMMPGLIPEKGNHETVVRIAAGLSSNEADTTAGNQPGIGLYDIMGRTIGSTHGHRTKIKDGDLMDIKVPFNHDVGKKPTEYIAVTDGGNDALCISYIALTQPDGTKKVWYGDIGKVCGADWYHSLLKTSDDDYQPSCIWIDRNRSNGLRYQGLGLHINDFAATNERAEQYNSDTNLMCKAAPRFRMYENMDSEDYIPYFDPPLDYEEKTLTDKDPKAVMDKNHWVMREEGPHIKKADIDNDPPPKLFRRQAPSAPVAGATNSSVVIISTSPNHSARELCDSQTSWGYDFASSTERLFCDMRVKRLWPVCNVNQTSACFDQQTSTMRPAKGPRGRDTVSGQVPPQKSYGKTSHWN